MMPTRLQRRRFLADAAKVGAVAVLPCALVSGRASANASSRVIHVGILISGTPDRWALIGDAITVGLREQGFVEGRNLVLHKRTATWPDKRMDAHVGELVGRNVDVIVTACGWTTKLASGATKTIPIVMSTIADPVGRGFVQSLARPGANVTGLTGQIPGLGPKMLEQLHLAIPLARTVAVLGNTASTEHDRQTAEVARAAATLGLRTIPVDLRRLISLDATVAALRDADAQAALILPDDDLFWEFLNSIRQAGDALRMPMIFPKRELVWHGGFMSFGADSHHVVRRAARHVARIVGGARPGDLPVEHPDRVELVINRTKADAYGIDVPRAALIQAAEVYRER